MKRRAICMTMGILLGTVLIFLAGAGYYIGTQSFMNKAGMAISEKASEILPVRVEIDSIRVDSLHSLTARGITIYDKQDTRMAEAESAQVDFSLFSVFAKSPLEAADKVTIRKVNALVAKRADGTWNYEELVSGNTTQNQFKGKVCIEDGTLTGRMDGKELTFEKMDGMLDFAAYPAIGVKLGFVCGGAQASIAGTMGNKRQTISIDASNLTLEDYLEFIPEGILPDNVKLISGKVDKLAAVFLKTGGDLSFNGQAEFREGRADIMNTSVTDVRGLLVFNEREFSVFANAQAEGQKASVHGKVQLDTGTPYMNLIVEAQAFDPGSIFVGAPFHGKASFAINLFGPVDAPRADGEIHVAAGNAYGYDFRNATAKVRYEDSHVAVRDLSADIFGGHIEAQGEFSARDSSYTAYLKATDLDASSLQDFVPGVSGRTSADVGISGMGTDMQALCAYGSVSALGAAYEGLAVPRMDASFYMEGPVIRIDALHATLPDDGSLSIEGTIMDRERMDLAFYGSHVDLSLMRKFVPQADMAGYADFKGNVQGNVSNPAVQVEFTAIEGKLFEQPFHTLHGSASGSLDGVGIDSFTMENGGKETWRVKGTVGLTGERRVSLQIDTMGARMEDIAALVAPDQPITGNVDNILTITGTMDDPHAIGYIHFYQGSYGGMLLSGMDGDYTVRNKIMTLHDFHIYSPMIDMDLNGTVDEQENLDLQVAAHQIEVERFGSKLPYPISGHGKFDGHIGGTLNAPLFDGALSAQQIVFNGQVITNARGTVRYRGHRVYMDSFGFEQNGGKYGLTLSADTSTLALDGRLDVQNGDVNALMAMFNMKNDILQGRLSGSIDLGGTLSVPWAHLNAFMGNGSARGYDINDIYMDARLVNHVITIDRFEGKQGNGMFAARGTVDLNGPIDARFSAKDIQAGALSGIAGSAVNVKGTVNTEAQFSGTIDNPSADISLDILGGGVGSSTFDSLTGLFNLKNGIINVNQLMVQKQVQGKHYKASAYGSVPLKALTTKEENPDDYEQFNLSVSLDEADLSLLPFLSKEIDWAIGETQGSLKITGTVAHPLVHGQVGFKDGAMKIRALGLPVTDMNADIRFEGDRISVNEISGKMGKGNYKLQGETRFKGLQLTAYDFSLNVDKLDMDCAFYKGPLSGTLHLNEGDFFGHKLPKLFGEIYMANATVSIPSIPDSSGALPDLLLDVDLKLGPKVHFYSPFLYDMQLAGAAHFGGTTHHPKTSGTISVLRGTVNYLKTSFTIREGEAYFNQIGSFLPSIFLRADTKLSHTRVYLGIDGAVDQMNFHLTSSPEMSETEIMQLLTLRSAYQSGQGAESDLSSLLNMGLQMSFLSEVEGAMRNVLNLDEFTIGRDTSTNDRKNADNSVREVYNVEMGKYISNKVMVKYTQGIGTETYRYGVQYDFNDHIGLTAFRNQDNAFTVGLEARFKF
jgi:translocation and assembly module TamB